jgi:MFS transporter, DHA1 family, tetracycline resistance protein
MAGLTKRYSFFLNKINLLLIMFIDGLGMSLVIPLLNGLFSEHDHIHTLLRSGTPLWLEQFYYAGSLLCFSLAMVIGACVLGQLSDIHGRKKTLYAALIGSVVGYLFCGLAIIIRSPLMFLIGRTIDGLTAGSIPVAQAMLADLGRPNQQITGIAQVMFAVTAGYICGPLIAFAFTMSAWQSYAWPFFMVALFCGFSLLLLTFLHEQVPSISRKLELDLSVIWKNIVHLWECKGLRVLLLSFFLFQCGWSFFYQYMPKITVAYNHIPGFSIAWAMAEVGVLMCLGFCFFVPMVQKILSLKKIIVFSLAIFSGLVVCYLIWRVDYIVFQLISVVMAVLYTLGYSSLLAFMLGMADDHQKGLLLGCVASICAISSSITALSGSVYVLFGYQIFFMTLFLMSVSSLFLFVFHARKA